MEAKEIILGMTNTPWTTGGEAKTGNITVGFEHIVVATLHPRYTEGNDASAICLAVNSTFGKGYDPSKMEEMYKKLEDVAMRFTHMQEHELATEIFQLLSTAKL